MKTVFFDIDTQLDFLEPAEALLCAREPKPSCPASRP